MAATLSATMQNAADTAANAAANGSKNTAYLNSISTSIGSGYKVKAYRNGTEVLAMTMTGSLTVSGGKITLPTSYASLDTLSTADIDSGTWVLRIEKASDATVYIEGSLGKSGGTSDFTLTADLVSGDDVTLGSIVLEPPQYDVVTTPSTNSAQKVYADVMGPNDGAPLSFYAYHGNPALQDPGFVLMGSYPVGSAFVGWGHWWGDSSQVWAQYKDGDYWTHAWGWAVFQEEASTSNRDSNLNNANNVGVAIRNVRMRMRRKSTGQWMYLHDTDSPGLFPASISSQYATDGVDTVTRWNAADGATELQLPRNQGVAWHYVSGGRYNCSAFVADIDAIHTCCEVKLIRWDTNVADDRSQARWLVYQGMDWMPDATSSEYNDVRPGAGASRFKRLRTDDQWEWINFANLLEMRQDNNNPSRHSVSFSSFSSNPPTF